MRRRLRRPRRPGRRPARRHAGHVDPADAPGRAGPRPQHRAAHRTPVGRRAARRAGLALSGAPSARRARVDRVVLGRRPNSGRRARFYRADAERPAAAPGGNRAGGTLLSRAVGRVMVRPSIEPARAGERDERWAGGASVKRAARERERDEEMRAHVELVRRGAGRPRPHGRRGDGARRGWRSATRARSRRRSIDMNRLPILDVLGRDVRMPLRVLRRARRRSPSPPSSRSRSSSARTPRCSASRRDPRCGRCRIPIPSGLAVRRDHQRGPRGPGIAGRPGRARPGRRCAVDRDLGRRRASAPAASASDVNLVVDQQASTVGQSRVSAGYFRVLGVAPAVRPRIHGDEDRAGRTGGGRAQLRAVAARVPRRHGRDWQVDSAAGRAVSGRRHHARRLPESRHALGRLDAGAAVTHAARAAARTTRSSRG